MSDAVTGWYTSSLVRQHGHHRLPSRRRSGAITVPWQSFCFHVRHCVWYQLAFNQGFCGIFFLLSMRTERYPWNDPRFVAGGPDDFSPIMITKKVELTELPDRSMVDKASVRVKGSGHCTILHVSYSDQAKKATKPELVRTNFFTIHCDL